ncbi:hypothetical protein SAMN06269301_1374 [Geobacter sp. DSM 9736]|nr:hypothetical protein SAMN06269301_1374 [Geobacter sp. DSM 9736]
MGEVIRVNFWAKYERLPFGFEGDPWSDFDICPMCDAKPGEYHERGCGIERCNICGGQSISCRCD